MNTAGTLSETTPSDNEIALTRVFNAPRQLVFDAWTKPELLRRWYTGDGAVLDTCDVDLRPAGRYRYVWKMAQGEMGMSGEFLEVEPPAHFVCTMEHDMPWYPGGTVMTAEFAEEGRQTTLLLILKFDSKEARDMLASSPWAEKYGEGFIVLDGVLADVVVSKDTDPEGGIEWLIR